MNTFPFDSFFQQIPIAFLVVNSQGQILHVNPWARQLFGMKVNGNIQNYVVDIHRRKLVEAIQESEPMFRTDSMFITAASTPMFVRCTTFLANGKQAWMIENAEELYKTKARLQQLQVLPREYGHEINNFLTVIGSMVEVMHMEAQTQVMEQDTEAILSIVNRAALQTRQFMWLGRKSVLAQEVVSLDEIIAENLEIIQDLLHYKEIQIRNIEDVQIFSSKWMLKSMLTHMALYFRELRQFEIGLSADIVELSNAFANEKIGIIHGKYVALSIFHQNFPYSVKMLSSSENIIYNEGETLSGIWENIKRSYGALAERRDANGHVCVTLYFPYIADMLQ